MDVQRQYHQMVLLFSVHAFRGHHRAKEQRTASNCNWGVKYDTNNICIALCTLLFYGIQIAGNRYVWVAHLQVLTVLPLIGIIYYFYRLANTEIMQRFLREDAGISWA